MTETEVKHIYERPENPERVRVKVIKNGKGYGWEVSVGSTDPDSVMEELINVEDQLVQHFGPENLKRGVV